MNYSTVTRIDVAPFGLLLIAAVILAICSTSRTDTPTAEAAPPPLTQSKAAEQCWMETEHGAKSLPSEKRAKVVDQCVKDKMTGAKYHRLLRPPAQTAKPSGSTGANGFAFVPIRAVFSDSIRWAVEPVVEVMRQTSPLSLLRKEG
jgi:hypothetical protein